MGSGSSKKSASAPAPKQIKEKPQKEKAAEKSAAPVPKPVAFEIKFEEKNEDSIIHKHPPKRLQRLEQSTQMGPKLTAKMLEDKLRIAEQNRQKELDKVRNLTSASRVRRQIHDAQEQDKKEEIIRGIEERERSAGKIRTNKLKEFENKKQEAAVKAQKAKERVNRLKNGIDDMEIEKDRYYDDYDDDWNLSSEKDNRGKIGTAKEHLSSNNNRTSKQSQGGSTKNKSNIFEDDDDFFR